MADRLLRQTFYARDPMIVAQRLLGMLLVRQTPAGVASGIIVETEAYRSRDDPASHSYQGRCTPRNAVMFGPAGQAYVYAIHSRWCLNVVTERAGRGSAVLIRAIEPLDGIELMQARRRCERLVDLARGPGRLCEALAIQRESNGWDLTLGDQLWIARPGGRRRATMTAASPRIGVSSAQELHLRYFLDGNPFVSGPRRYHRQPVAAWRREAGR